jgi:hypothetical protein
LWRCPTGLLRKTYNGRLVAEACVCGKVGMEGGGGKATTENLMKLWAENVLELVDKI